MAGPDQTQSQIKPEQIIDILIRGKWIIIISLCISLTLGLFYTLTANRTYQAFTQILVQPQRVPTSYVQSVVSSTISDRISTISQQILSRSNLEQIIDQFGLFEGQEDMYLEDKIESLRQRIQVRIKQDRRIKGEADTFSISFKGSDPKQVMQIANRLASYFMDENLKVREAQAIGTREFLEAELEKTRARLEEKERKLAAFRSKYLGGLPDELEANLRTMDRLQMQMTGKNELLREVKNALSLLDTQISQAKLAETQSGNPVRDPENPEELTDAQKLANAQEEYDNLLLKYTEKHPDVQKLKKTVEKLEESIAEAEKKPDDRQDAAGRQDNQEEPEAQTDLTVSMMMMEAHRRQLAGEITTIQAGIEKLQQEMIVYQKRVEETPKRELELQALKRDYANIQNTYNSLLDRKLEAELSVNMEIKQKGEQFRILDHARMPEKPISPDVRKLFLLSVALGLGIGGGIVFLKEFINLSRIRWDDQIEQTLGLNILASIPPLEQSGTQLKQKIGWVIFAGFCCYALFFLSFFAVLHVKGLDRAVNFMKMTFNI